MKHKLLFYLLFLYCLNSFAQWNLVTNYPSSGVHMPFCFTASGKAYMGCGFNSSIVATISNYEYDANTNTWTTKSVPPFAARMGAFSFSIGGYGYVGSGSPNGSAVVYNDFWRYDPVSDTWTAMASFPGVGRIEAATFVINGKGYVVGGIRSAGSPSDCWEYDPVTNNWSAMSNPPAGFTSGYLIGFSHGNYGYTGIGGYNSSSNNDFWRFEPATNTWLQLASLPAVPTTRTWAIGGVDLVAGKGFVGLGGFSAASNVDFWTYDFASNTWQSTPTLYNFPYGIANSRTFNLGGETYAGTGIKTGGFENKIYKFSCSSIPNNINIGLLAHYPFNSGSTDDFSGNAHHLNNTNAISAADRNGTLNCALEFDNLPSSNNQFLSTTNSAFLDGLTEYSISCWYKPLDNTRDAGAFESLVNRDSGTPACSNIGQWSLGLGDCRYATFQRDNYVIQNFGPTCDVSVLTDVWQHVTATYNQVGNTIKIYKNGVLQNTASGSSSCSIADIGDLFLGKDYTGVLDDVFIHNREITASEVTQLFSLGSSCCPTTNPCTAAIVPTFSPIGSICSGSVLSPLPTTSNNDITGTWTPALDNTTTTTYTFTPDAGQCATITTLEIIVNSTTSTTTIPISTGIDAYNYLGPIFLNVDINWNLISDPMGVTGSYPVGIEALPGSLWEPTPIASTNARWINNSGYHAGGSTPGLCTYEKTISVPSGSTHLNIDFSIASDDNLVSVELIQPDSTSIPLSVSSSSAFQLSLPIITDIINPMAGDWKIRVITSISYPPIGTESGAFLLSGNALLTAPIVCETPVTPTFDFSTSICSGEATPDLPTTSSNGITGTWSPALNNTATTTYTFTPDCGQCASATTLTITVNSPSTNITTITNCSSYTWSVNGVTYTTSGIYSEIVGCTIGLLYLTIETPSTWYIDADGDGAGNPAISIVDCVQPSGYVNNDNDCDDTNATINPCAIENRTDGIDNNCNGVIDEIVTKLVASHCGISMTSINQLLVATAVTPASSVCGYRFKVTKWVGGAPSTNPADEQILPRSSNTFALTMLAQYAYNTTYSVQVSVCFNGVWQPYGADCCNVRCNKLSKVQSSQCGSTLTSMSDWINADIINFIMPGTSNPWRFEITQVTPGAGFGTVQTYDTNLRRFSMNNFVATYDTTYSVRVAFLNVDGTWSSFGLPCTVTTPSVKRLNDDTPIDSTQFEAVVYPNPAVNDFRIEVKTASKEPIFIKVYDLLGRLVEDKQTTIDEIYNLQLGNFYPSGVYQVIVKQETNTKALKVIKR